MEGCAALFFAFQSSKKLGRWGWHLVILSSRYLSLAKKKFMMRVKVVSDKVVVPKDAPLTTDSLKVLDQQDFSVQA